MSISISRLGLIKVVCIACLPLVAGMASAANNSSVKRINVGGSAFTDSSGQKWLADYGFKNGYKVKDRNLQIKKTNQDRVYQSQRRHKFTDKELNYVIPVPNGNYSLKLHFAEMEQKAFGKGKRVFDVYAEGRKELSGIDVFKQSGSARAAMTRSISYVKVNDGKINLKFKAKKYAGLISGIEIKSLQGKNIAGKSTSSNSSSNTKKTITANTSAASSSASSGSGLKITSQPSNALASPGSTISLKVGASGSGIKYQWFRKGGTMLKGEKSSQLRFASIQKKDAGQYYCVVRNNNKRLYTKLVSVVVSGTNAAQTSKSATLSWAAPTKRTNGKTLKRSEIAEFEIFHGRSASNMSMYDAVDGRKLNHLIKGLSPGNHFFAIQTVDNKGARSNRSRAIKVVVR
ncbi:hypothetical protein FT643_05545 [Ketobacter sp. MCCC 1A13808]|uniref:malectin domain-containing carbohydrate-binding protein n=1 Tax=Ketobacter sp. MCCC 1A13808 TaxID=2602738 RepID=UPI0012EC3F4D|nr:malectin domain-containing carbohydrate-binding protein [Ketobacter sp. MCCC 1A13808]MVF11604.1 hypothetical protein [Ketobacter sp. MCCC 1A13808]